MRTAEKCGNKGEYFIRGQVIKAVASKFTVITDDKTRYTCFLRGRVKRDIDIYVGDYVEIDGIRGATAIIEEVYPRKNTLIRPYISNIDCLIIVVAPTPAPDWVLVDKMIINCYIEGIRPMLCFNKRDLTDRAEIERFFAPYKNELPCVAASAEQSGGLTELLSVMEGGLSCFAGQSAVGKSSLLNAILGRQVMEVCGMSERIQRGKNTTRHIEIFDYGTGRLADTCGFSLFEFENLLPSELTFYYTDYITYMPKCRYKNNCSHISEPECEIKKQVASGVLSAERYQRYIAIYNELKEKQDDKY